MGVLGVDGVAGPKAEFLLMSSALLLSSSSSTPTSASMPPSHAAGDMSGYWQAKERGYWRKQNRAIMRYRILTYGYTSGISPNNQTKNWTKLFKNKVQLITQDLHIWIVSLLHNNCKTKIQSDISIVTKASCIQFDCSNCTTMIYLTAIAQCILYQLRKFLRMHLAEVAKCILFGNQNKKNLTRKVFWAKLIVWNAKNKCYFG